MTQKGTRKKETDIYNQMQERKKKKKETKAETAILILEKENMTKCF